MPLVIAAAKGKEESGHASSPAGTTAAWPPHPVGELTVQSEVAVVPALDDVLAHLREEEEIETSRELFHGLSSSAPRSGGANWPLASSPPASLAALDAPSAWGTWGEGGAMSRLLRQAGHNVDLTTPDLAVQFAARGRAATNAGDAELRPESAQGVAAARAVGASATSATAASAAPEPKRMVIPRPLHEARPAPRGAVGRRQALPTSLRRGAG